MYNRLVILFSLIIFSLSVQNIKAQQKKKLFNENILTEVKTIQKQFSDSMARYDFKKDSVLFSSKYRTFYGKKIELLKSLSQKYKDDQLIGKFDSDKSTDKSIDTGKIENFHQLEDLKKQLTINFPTHLMYDHNSGTYRCKLTFVIDADGKFKRIKYEGSSTEFNLISVLFLQAIGSLEKPLLLNKKPFVNQFTQPITLILE